MGREFEGGAGSGKSTVARRFGELGAEVLDADAAARQAVAVGRPAWRELRRLFGPECFQPDGELNRARVARLVLVTLRPAGVSTTSSTPGWPGSLRSASRSWSARGAGLVLVEAPLRDMRPGS